MLDDVYLDFSRPAEAAALYATLHGGLTDDLRARWTGPRLDLYIKE